MGNVVCCPLCGSGDTEVYRTAFYRLPAKAKTDGRPVWLMLFPAVASVKPIAALLLILWLPIAIIFIPSAVDNPIVIGAMPAIVLILGGIPIFLAGIFLDGYRTAKHRPREVEEWMRARVCWNCGNNFYADVQADGAPNGSSLHKDLPHTARKRDTDHKYVYEHTYARHGDSKWLFWLFITIATVFVGFLHQNFSFVWLIAIFLFSLREDSKWWLWLFIAMGMAYWGYLRSNFPFMWFVAIALLSFSLEKRAKGVMRKLRACVSLNSFLYPYPTLFLRYCSSRMSSGDELLWFNLKIPLIEIAGVERISFPDLLSQNFPGMDIKDGAECKPDLKKLRYMFLFNRHVASSIFFARSIQSFVRSIQAEGAKCYSYILLCDWDTPHEAAEGVEILLFDGSRVVFETDDAENIARLLLKYSHIGNVKFPAQKDLCDVS
jgi:hypothetical protein